MAETTAGYGPPTGDSIPGEFYWDRTDQKWYVCVSDGGAVAWTPRASDLARYQAWLECQTDRVLCCAAYAFVGTLTEAGAASLAARYGQTFVAFRYGVPRSLSEDPEAWVPSPNEWPGRELEPENDTPAPSDACRDAAGNCDGTCFDAGASAGSYRCDNCGAATDGYTRSEGGVALYVCRACQNTDGAWARFAPVTAAELRARREEDTDG